MTRPFRMNAPQPRLLDETRQGVIGAPLDRPEGPKKVTGRAAYAADVSTDGMATGVLVRATISRGRVIAIHAEEIEALPGVIGVFHGPDFIRNPAQGMAGEAPVQTGADVHYHGQPIALVVGETFEAARDGALRVKISYETADGARADPADTETHEVAAPETAGNFDAAFDSAAVRVDSRYATPGHASAAMEPHAALAEWHNGALTLRGSMQMLRFNKQQLADALNISPDALRLLSPFVGGGFGSKLGIGPEAVAAAVAARDLGRPVRVVMSRQTVFDAVLRRSETEQHLRIGADASGRITALSHDDLVSNLMGESFSEPVSQASQFLYGADGLSFTQTLSRNTRTPSGSVRAPGEAVGMLALEQAMDELADALGICPVELRLMNIPEETPMDGLPYSARRLADCLREGAERFGWSARMPTGSRREGDWMIGMGVASAARANGLVKSAARVRLGQHGAVVETDMTDIGTGTYAILGQIVAEMLGLPVTSVEVRLGDSDLPGASGSGGSFGANSAGSATFLAAKAIREILARKLGCAPEDLTLQDGIARGANREAKLADLIAEEIVEEASIEAGETADTHKSSGFGAHFAEVAVHAWTGEVRVRRMLGVIAMGRILNHKTARSQALGGMVWGLGAALTEELTHDPRTGHIVTRDLANYHVASHADIPPEMDVVFLEERDDMANPIQTKGIGELGISGAGAAVLNAIHNASGARIHDLPATPDKVIAALDAALT